MDERLVSIKGSLETAPSLPGALLGDGGIQKLLGAHGVAVVHHGRAHTLGKTPDTAFILALCDWLAEIMGSEGIWHTDRLAAAYPPAEAFMDMACGLAATRLAQGKDEFLLFFRPEMAKTVHWAGDPNKPVTAEDGTERISPRTSFEKWKQTVRGSAAPWTKAEMYALARLRILAVDASVNLTTRELLQVNQELEQKNREIDSFAYLVSHDLKEPLRGLVFHAQTLQESASEGLDEDGQRRLERIAALSGRMRDLIESLLKYSRSGTREVVTKPTELGLVLQECLTLLKDELAANGVEVRVPQLLPVVECDPDKVREVFLNLLANAIKYGAEAGPVIEVGFTEPAQGSTPTLYVRDNGIGIDPKHHETVFALFRRLHARETYGGGTGAGLAIVKKIVERHGGRVWVESALGQGATFFFTLAPDPATPTNRRGSLGASTAQEAGPTVPSS